ncbi:MAG: TolB family protein [Bacteroidales bacterium]
MAFILLLFVTGGLYGQFYEYGQDAGTLKWNHFRTPNYHVIYPRGVDSLAQAFADRLEHFYPYLGRPLDHRHAPLPVIIHNESSFSNGVYVYAPKRLEIFTNPDPNDPAEDWLTQLALHEGRHAFQIDKLNQGITHALSFLGGEQVVGAMGVFLPYWYLEGDAVDAETRLSNTGRGRQPSFEMPLKAQMLGKDRIYTFSKATMGSYRDYIPNHYELGYLMVRYGRMVYGDDLWIDFQQYAARRPYLLNPTYFAMRKHGIPSKREFYLEALNSYKQHWNSMAEGRSYTPDHFWEEERTRSYTSYRFPHYVSSSMVFAMKSGMDQIPEFVLVDPQGKEKRIFRPGFLNSGRVSFSGRHVVWDEFVPDVRWSNRNYSVIRTYELSTGKVRSLGHKTRYYSPVLSKEGSQIAAIEQTVQNKYNLVILSLDGSVEASVPSPDHRFIQVPAWSERDTALLVVVSEPEGKSLYSYTPASEQWQRLFSAGFEDITQPLAAGNRIFFQGSFSGINNIYCLNLTEMQVYQVTSAKFGAFDPQLSSDGKTLLYANYTGDGYKVATMLLEEGLWRSLEQASDHKEQLGYQHTAEEKSIIDSVPLTDTLTYPVRKYSKIAHLFNFHSWLPLYFDYLNPELELNPEHLPVSLGVSLISQNLLSTAVSQLGYEYRDGTHMFHSGIQLKGRLPVFNFYFDYGGEPDVLVMAEGDTLISTPQDMRITAQSYIPIRLNTGKYLTLLQPRIDYSYRRDVQYDEGEGMYRVGAHYLYYRFDALSYLRKGVRDILPRLGINTSAGYYHAPFKNQVYGAVALGSVTAYLPGVLKHQTLKLAAQVQRQFPLDMSHPAFINLMSLPRGLKGIFGEVLTKYSADYVFPLLYPDLTLTSLLYVKRIRTALWADHMTGTNVIIREPHPHFEDKTYTTLGADLIFDLNLMRISFPLSVGGRVIYEPGTGTWELEWIYAIDIN